MQIARLVRDSMRSKPEEKICKQFAATGSCPYSPRCRFSHQLPSASPPPTHQTSSASTSQTTTTAATAADWSPLDDGIEVKLPGSSSTDKPPSREEVNASINRFLNRPMKPRRRRLTVFEDFCPSRDKN
ncbi:hypothetical protein CK203_001948 [Vitis vinifera]|uniref:C3H1-type domain-containing protein n=1 Tax=Vitis vinifera TaxID=29760 RepID=A0A438KJ10_VITVI|nr:hypothetical protein CK203_001948 [Vitis vinifera]